MRSIKFVHYSMLLLLMAVSHQLFSQSEKKVLDFETFISIVKQHHPMFRQAELQITVGEANLLMARGSFDPQLYGDLNQKYFDGAQYYSLLDAGLKVPTWFGIELKGGFEQNAGVYLDPHYTTPDAGLAYAGISLPLGKGLLIDERRTELQKAKIFKESTIARQQELVNELVLEAGKAYWNWFEKYNSLKVHENAYDRALIRYEAIVESADLGDRPAIDSIEASMQLQQRIFNLQQARAEVQSSRNTLSVFLWNEGLIPMEISETTLPVDYLLLPLSERKAPLAVDETVIEKHPIIRQTQMQIEIYQAELRWKKEQLKPEIDLKYNALNTPVGNNPFAAYSINNYKWGVDLAFPVLLRKERGGVQLANLKVSDYQLELASKRASILAKAKNALLDWQMTTDQLVTVERLLSDSQKLLEGEQDMFENGESSLFMINAREMTAFSSELKVIETKSKNQKSRLYFDYSLGQLAN